VLAAAIRVRRGYAFGDARLLGKVSFSGLPGPYPFILCVPQSQTEQALEQRLTELAPTALRRGHEVVDSATSGPSARIDVRSADGSEYSVQARFLVGCDGKRSRVREAAAIPYSGGSYGEHFAMADVRDDTPFGEDAAIFLSRAGVVESFPLPGARRRWVVALGRDPVHVDAAIVERLVGDRTGQLASASTATMVSTFMPEHYMAARFAQGPVALAGDSAHVVSPIGGQGMSLGWLDAKLLSDVLAAAMLRPERAPELLASYERTRRRAARAATRRAELFMAIGQTQRLQTVRDLFVEGLLSAPLVGHAAQLFTMRGLTSAGVV
jgi:2-polyprenyl-6-methoxyphenol hydroxylase-like FAD-dependent oxidoreductase